MEGPSIQDQKSPDYRESGEQVNPLLKSKNLSKLGENLDGGRSKTNQSEN